MQDNINIIWTLIEATFVFFMQAGFALVELGLTRSKNATNIIFKSLMNFTIGSLSFFVIRYRLMFGEGNGIFGLRDFFLCVIKGNYASL